VPESDFIVLQIALLQFVGSHVCPELRGSILWGWSRNSSCWISLWVTVKFERHLSLIPFVISSSVLFATYIPSFCFANSSCYSNKVSVSSPPQKAFHLSGLLCIHISEWSKQQAWGEWFFYGLFYYLKKKLLRDSKYFHGTDCKKLESSPKVPLAHFFCGV